MIQSEQMVGKNRKRDAHICNLWASEKQATSQIAEAMQITERRVQQILEANHLSLSANKDWELIKDVHRIDVEIKKKTSSRKDLADLIALKHQLLGNGKPAIDASIHITNNFPLAETLKKARERRDLAIAKSRI